MIKVKRLTNNKLVDDACALLYQAHIEQTEWNYSPDNPSNIKVITKNNKKLLVDRFTRSAIWFGAFDNTKLVGCTRLTFPDENNRLEIEGYENSSIIQEFLPINRDNCVESTRTAVLSSHTGLGVVRAMLLEAFKYCENKKYSLSATVSNGYLISLLKKIGFPLKKEYAFKYENQDPIPVNYYFADYAKSEIKNMIIALENYKQNVKGQHSRKIFSALDIVAAIIPMPVYWHDINGVVLGVNSYCLEGMGAPTSEYVIGKTPYDFYPKEIADHIWQHSKQVIKTGEVLSQDEQIKDITTGKIKVFRNIKAPLYNDDGAIIGIIGSAMDVTIEKEAEQLKLITQAQQAEIEKHRAVAEEQARFQTMIEQMLHIINSFKISTINYKLGNPQPDLSITDIYLTKREKEILFYLAQHKSPKSIANILSKLENKIVAPKTIQSIIDKQLYLKFQAYNVDELLDKAKLLNKIPFSL